jgi:hypothetical protein
MRYGEVLPRDAVHVVLAGVEHLHQQGAGGLVPAAWLVEEGVSDRAPQFFYAFFAGQGGRSIVENYGDAAVILYLTVHLLIDFFDGLGIATTP